MMNLKKNLLNYINNIKKVIKIKKSVNKKENKIEINSNVKNKDINDILTILLGNVTIILINVLKCYEKEKEQ